MATRTLVFAALTVFAITAAASPTNPCYPDPNRCICDYDDGTGSGTPDGGSGLEDLLYYLHIYADGSMCADFDDGSMTGTPDGGVTIEDLLFVLSRFDCAC